MSLEHPNNADEALRAEEKTEEFNLSDKTKKVFNAVDENGHSYRDMLMIKKDDVKEFIRLLKRDMPMKAPVSKWLKERIDKLAGEKLI